MPRNVAGKPIDPIEYNRNDGFSPGSPIVTKVPGLDNEAALDADAAPCRRPTWPARSTPTSRSS